MKNALYIQSGGPTAVINASAYGVITACKKYSENIGRLYAARHGMKGLLENRLIDVFAEDAAELALLPQTPSSVFGSCRYRIADGEKGEKDYENILNCLRRYNIGYIFYNGGNGTLRACRDLLEYIEKAGFACNVVAIPKTVDNDIYGLDHAPGFPSAARHVAITVAELSRDMMVYDTGLVMVLEVMGRNTGWLAAASVLAGKYGAAPDLIYTPECKFDPQRFVNDVKRVYAQKGKCLVVVAEGVKTPEGKYLFEYGNAVFDNSPTLNMGGITPYLTHLLKQQMNCKIRGIDLGLMQRCGMHTVSALDIEEALMLGEYAVESAVNGQTAVMAALERLPGRVYQTQKVLLPIQEVSQQDGSMPLSYINKAKNGIDSSFLEYILPLVGEMPRYARLEMKTTE